MEKPGEVSDFTWATMNDQQRRFVCRHIVDNWWNDAGQHWTDEQWLSMLLRPHPS